LSDDLVAKLQLVIDEEDFSESRQAKASKAAFGISKWCRAIAGYHNAMKAVTPVKIELASPDSPEKTQLVKQ